MHEVSLLEEVRCILNSHAQTHQFRRVTQLTLEIGRLSCVEPDALRFAFDAVMEGSLAEGAGLVITTVDGLGLCTHCGANTVIENLYDVCGHCGNHGVTVIQGMDMKIKDLTVI